ncbi:MAG TPA: sugar ABC transporter permease [Lachnospiraceae bacterium]|nr:sugar ABC transporter permease [Lachnospiraceae bacterium]
MRRKTVQKRKKSTCSVLILSTLAFLVIVPVGYMIVCSFQKETGTGFSLMGYYHVFLAEPGYLMKFWRSLALCLAIACGQTIVSCMAGTAFAKYRVIGKKVLFGLMLLFMLLPIQVTLLPNYILLDRLQFLNSWKALIIPGIFAPFGTVWLTFVFRSLPGEMLEAASLDGANRLQNVFLILAPAARPSVITLFILSFVESWNMVEQPITFLEGVRQYPLSVFLAGIQGNSMAVQSVCGILCLFPVTFLFFYHQEELMEGIGESIWN